ncbi:zinc transporter ZIP1-like [Panulirus ornatus]|uniref:zinc transporter ZIP1-like n=1 Tax=Panulirus ornatus TaxID=150431 RepID=UPI003A8A3DE7
MEVMQMQFLFMGMIFLLTTGVGLAPVALRGALSKRLVPRAAVRSRLLSCASCFGAGVFIFVCFMGLLPAADRKFHHFLEELGHTNESWEDFAEFPWGFFVVTCGFLIIFTIDKLVHAMEHSRGETGSSATHILLTKSSVGSATQRANGGDAEVREDTNDHDYCKDYHGGGHGVPSSVIFLMALGIHSLFEGMAVGLQTQKDKVLEFSVAVLVHETVMAFTFGMEVSKSHGLSRCTKALYVLIFTSTIPLGIAAGVGLQNAPSDNREIVSAVLEAFATGIFIHVIFIEVLAKEFPGHHHHHHHKHIDSHPKSSSPPSETCLMLEKVSCICCGLVTLILINVFMHAHH